MIVIRHQIFEAGTSFAYPVVTHEFRGKNITEARSYLDAHRKYDQFFRAASATPAGDFHGVRFKSLYRVITE